MSITTVISVVFVLCEEEPRVDEFVQQGLIELVERAIFQQRHAEPHDAEESFARMPRHLVEIADTRTLGHALGPFQEYFTFEVTFEESLVVSCKQIVYVGVDHIFISLENIIRYKFLGLYSLDSIPKLDGIFR